MQSSFPEWTSPEEDDLLSAPLVRSIMTSTNKTTRRMSSVSSASTAINNDDIREIASNMNLDGIIDVCDRLSIRNKAIV